MYSVLQKISFLLLFLFVSLPLFVQSSDIFLEQQGVRHYNKICKKCHGPLEISRKRGRSLQDLQWAVQYIPLMEKGRHLSKKELQGLVLALQIDAKSCQVQSTPWPVQSLSFLQIERSLSDFLGEEVRGVAQYFPQVTGKSIFEGETGPRKTSFDFHLQGLEFYSKVAKKVLKSANWKQRIRNCENTQKPNKCRRKIVRQMLAMLYRRPVRDKEVSEIFLKLKFKKEGYKAYTRAALFGLMSPKFFLKNLPLEGENRDEMAFAQRLSLFLWGRGPDDSLIKKAQAGSLQKSEVLRSEVRRMMADPRSNYLFDSYFMSWTGIRHIEAKEMDPELFPKMTALRKKQFIDQARRFFNFFKNSKQPYNQMFQAPKQLERRLASAIAPSAKWKPPQGLLNLPAWLMTYSGALESSVTRRGRFIREQLLCSELAPPLGKDKKGEKMIFEFTPGLALTGRQQMQRHVTLSSCANCHQMMDPLGVAFENFDAIGRWRTQHHGLKIDPSTHFSDVSEVKDGYHLQKILSESKALKNCLIEKVAVHALDRPLRKSELCSIYKIKERAEKAGFSFESIIYALVSSSFFQGGLSD